MRTWFGIVESYRVCFELIGVFYIKVPKNHFWVLTSQIDNEWLFWLSYVLKYVKLH